MRIPALPFSSTRWTRISRGKADELRGLLNSG
jgi:hypothetical protein